MCLAPRCLTHQLLPFWQLFREGFFVLLVWLRPVRAVVGVLAWFCLSLSSSSPERSLSFISWVDMTRSTHHHRAGVSFHNSFSVLFHLFHCFAFMQQFFPWRRFLALLPPSKLLLFQSALQPHTHTPTTGVVRSWLSRYVQN